MTENLNPFDLVEKPGGYPFPGIYLASFVKPDGTVMANVESLFHPGMIHVFPVRLIQKFDGTRAELMAKHNAFLAAQNSESGTIKLIDAEAAEKRITAAIIAVDHQRYSTGTPLALTEHQDGIIVGMHRAITMMKQETING